MSTSAPLCATNASGGYSKNRASNGARGCYARIQQHISIQVRAPRRPVLSKGAFAADVVVSRLTVVQPSGGLPRGKCSTVSGRCQPELWELVVEFPL
eukprot:2861859-Pyramimonas_sp.AAC.1